MGVMHDGLNRMRVRTQSPQGAFGIDFSVADGLRVEVGPKGFAGHDDDSLARDLTAGLGRTRAGTRKALATLRDKAGIRPPAPDEPETRWRRRRRELTEATATVETTGASPRGIVTVRFKGSGDITVEIQRGALRRFHDEQLLAEINTVLATVRRRHAVAMADTRHLVRKGK